jgi:hypothetical protein
MALLGPARLSRAPLANGGKRRDGRWSASARTSPPAGAVLAAVRYQRRETVVAVSHGDRGGQAPAVTKREKRRSVGGRQKANSSEASPQSKKAKAARQTTPAACSRSLTLRQPRHEAARGERGRFPWPARRTLPRPRYRSDGAVPGMPPQRGQWDWLLPSRWGVRRKSSRRAELARNELTAAKRSGIIHKFDGIGRSRAKVNWHYLTMATWVTPREPDRGNQPP